jgi:hypothetical protein
MTTKWRETTPEGLVLDYEQDGERVTRAMYEPRSLATKLHNAELRKHDVPRDTPLGRPALSMEMVDIYTASKLFPDLMSPDADSRNKAWRKFIASPMSDPYKVIDGVN